MPDPVIHVRGLAHAYGAVPVLSNVDVDVAPGEFVSLMGASGAGKSTLLAVLGGLERPQAGRVVVADRDLAWLAGDALAEYRRTAIGFVFQHFGLLTALTAAENVELSLALAATPRASRRARARELLELVGLGHRSGHLPSALSGGEQQRVAIARALANRPAVVLADEPTGNLDRRAGAHVLDLLQEACAERGAAVVLVTHDESSAARARRRYLLEDGTLRAA